MVTAFLMGGLGNQMFQIAVAHSIALDNNDEAVFDFTKCHTPHQGNTSDRYENNLFKLVKSKIDIKYQHLFEEAEINVYKQIPYNYGLMIRGYFQNIKYFKHHQKQIQDLFYIDQNNIFFIKDKFKNFTDFSNTTSVHVRRGDYLKFPDVHPLCSKEYYANAMNTLIDQKFIFVSDDIEWVKQNFKGSNITYSDLNDEVLDLTLMTMCSNNIIANSSFSWWGAFLNRNKNKQVLSPPCWI